MDNWSRLHIKLASLCPDFSKDSKVCRNKWSSIYNDYKEDKAMNMRLVSNRSKKFRWYQAVDEFMSNRVHVVSHTHANATNPYGINSISASDTHTSEHKSGESPSKSSEPKRKEDVFLDRRIGDIRESSKNLMDSLKVSDDMKIALLISMQQTM